MQTEIQPIVQDLVLIGGGHSHAIALKQLGMNPIPGVRLTLIADVVHTPYSGMLPGYVAGAYTFDECHIDLRPLTRFAGAILVVDRAIGLDLVHNRVICANHPPIRFDSVSLDIGITPAISQVPGGAEYAIPVKPISRFLHHWEALLAEVEAHPSRPLRLVLVGGGAGGVELAFNQHAQLQRLYQQIGHPHTPLEIHLIQRGQTVLPERSSQFRQRVQQMMEQRGIRLHCGETVVAIEPGKVRCESGKAVEYDRLFWVTQAAAAPWVRESGLATDSQGFVQVNEYLQSISHPQVFAAGDIAALPQPRPKAGVFAVRAGKPLVHNLRRALTGRSLRPFTPQKEFLILLGTGDGQAIASRGALSLGPHPWLWDWKDRIDRAFMNQFTHLPAMNRSRELAELDRGNPDTDFAGMRCAGCGAKVSRSVLERSLQRIQQDFGLVQRDDIVLGLDNPDDAAVVSVPAGQVLVQTVDYFRALLDDPFLLGQIVTTHCLSDLYAMGATPQSALAIATLPYGLPAQVEETLYQLLAGTVKVLHSAGATLIGGHTNEGAELALGLTCNGLSPRDRLLRKTGLLPDHVLILTKPLGTGVLFAAEMRLQAKGRWIEQAIQSMLLSNKAGAEILQQWGAIACTDVTGFGLIGHLLEMVRSAPVQVELNLAAMPLLEGAITLSAAGIHSSLFLENLRASQYTTETASVKASPQFPLLFDPQTSGGLLAAVPAEAAAACLSTLRASGYVHSAIIGRIVPKREQDLPVRIEM